MLKNFVILACTLALCYAVAELVFGLLLAREAALPLVRFYTERKEVVLWAYDSHFNGVADLDLREEIPYQLTYCCNEDANPYLDATSPSQVPHAVEVVLNPQATRDRNWRDLPENAEVTLVVGDSFCFGQGVREQDRFSNLLEDELNARRASDSGHPLVFLAQCRPGADVQGAAQLLERLGGKIPNVRRVIYAYTLNDPIQDERLMLMQKFINDFMHQRVRGFGYMFPQPELSGTPLLRWLKDQALKRQISRETIAWYHELHRGPTWEETMGTIRAMDEFAREHGFPFTLVVFPLFHNFDDYPFTEIHDTVVQFARENDIEVVDLFEAFAGTDEKDFWVHPKDFHPNHHAHAKVADFLLERIPW